MKLKEYLEALNQLAKEHPEALEFDCVYARDDEGNGYCRGVCAPSLCWAEEGDYYPDVFGEEGYKDWFETDEFNPNSIMIN